MTKLQVVENMIEELPLRQKIALVRKLEKETSQNSIEAILKRISARVRKHPLSTQEISREVKAVRKKLYVKYYN